MLTAKISSKDGPALKVGSNKCGCMGMPLLLVVCAWAWQKSGGPLMCGLFDDDLVIGEPGLLWRLGGAPVSFLGVPGLQFRVRG
jgi:hypothetical protein